jgi:MscS family membrane protein
MYVAAVLVCVLCCSAMQAAQLGTPRQTITTFVMAMAQQPPNIAMAARTLDAGGLAVTDKNDVARMLHEIQLAKGLMASPKLVPNDSAYVDTVMDARRYPIPGSEGQIELVRVGNEWLFSRSTVSAIPTIHNNLFPLGLEVLRNSIPTWGPRFLGISVWQWLLMVAMAVCAFLANRMLRGVVTKLSRWMLNVLRIHPQDSSSVARMARALTLFFVSRVVLALVPLLHLPSGTMHNIRYALGGLCMAFTIVTIFRLVDVVSKTFIDRITTTKLKRGNSTALLMLSQTILKSIVVLVGGVWALERMGVNFTALVAGISIGGAAIALASQDTIRNVFGSLMIFVDRPFSVGDWIVTEKIEGIVEEIGLRSTRIRTFAHSIITTPNGRLADMTIDNLGVRTFRRIRVVVTIAPTTMPEHISAFQRAVETYLSSLPFVQHQPDMLTVHLTEISERGIICTITCFVDKSYADREPMVKNELIITVVDQARLHSVLLVAGVQ